MEDPFDPATARKHIWAILDGSGMTDLAPSPDGWRYQAVTQRMTVDFSFRGHGHSAASTPNELVIESVRRNKR